MSIDGGHFTVPLSRLAEPYLAGLAARLDELGELRHTERAVVHDAVRDALLAVLERKLTRLLVLEFNATRLAGELHGADPAARWADFLDRASRPVFWHELAVHYPTLRGRLHVLIGNRCTAGLAFAGHFAADRAALAGLVGGPVGELRAVRLGAGDSHRGGRTVAHVRCDGGQLFYKPRSVAIDLRLQRLLDAVLDGPRRTRIRVPRCLDRGGHGWAEHVRHRYCGGPAELDTFYRGLGQWLAVMRLLGGSDLHAENLIACGPVPVVVDCETLFTPHHTVTPSGFGQAVDRAAELVAETVLRTGLLPERGLTLGLRGVDMSAAGSLPGEQPTASWPALVDAGTDAARVRRISRRIDPTTTNRPSRDAALVRHWPQVLAGFDELTARLTELDRTGRLDELVGGFADCPMRVVLRGTEVYAELGRMLWHPVSLHDEPSATRRAVDLLVEQAANAPGVPGDPAVAAAEVADLLIDDVPFYGTTPATGRLTGPGGITWGSDRNLAAEALRRWRRADPEPDRQVIRATLVSAYLNESSTPDAPRMAAVHPDPADLDRRRRAMAASLIDRLAETAVRGADGTVTWIAPSLTETGWSVRPLNPDLYNGLAGVACLLAAYRHEVRAGRADPHPEVDELAAAALTTLRAGEDTMARRRRRGLPMRPATVGGYVGLGSQISTWLLIDTVSGGVDGDGDADTDTVGRARACAELLPDAIGADQWYDVLMGMAGAIDPLLRLAARTGEPGWTDLAEAIGDRLAVAARISERRACWPNAKSPDGLGGFSHGSTGIGWALSRLAHATGHGRHHDLANAAFAFEDHLWSPAHGGWLDLRFHDTVTHAWCSGSAGIGLAAAEQLAVDPATSRHHRVLRRAVTACWTDGMGWTHTLCHGDFGNRELVQAALDAGAAPPGVDLADLDARLVTSLERLGPVCGVTGATHPPGLLTGISGIAYQLLRMHPDRPLPSVLRPPLHTDRRPPDV